MTVDLRSPGISIGLGRGIHVGAQQITGFNWTALDSIDFDGVDERIAIDKPSFAAGPLSLSCWVKRAGANGNHVMIGSTSIALQEFNGKMAFRVGSGLAQSVTNFTTGTWWHVVGTRSAANLLTIYVNGALEATDPGTANAGVDPWYIGQGWDNFKFFNGLIDEVSLWDKELSLLEVTELYNSGAPYDQRTHSASANLKHYFPFERSIGDLLPGPIYDIVGSVVGVPSNMDVSNWSNDVAP